MALIADITTKRIQLHDRAEDLVSSLDIALFNVGVGVNMIRDMSLHGSPGSGSTDCDPEELAALAEGLLAYLAQVGLIIDRLETVVSPHLRRVEGE